jgi:hypothetical protein
MINGENYRNFVREFSILIPGQAITCREGKYVLADVAKFEAINHLPGNGSDCRVITGFFKKNSKNCSVEILSKTDGTDDRKI